jgi:ribose transport system ATP-binding protein
LLELRGITKRFGGVVALQDVNLSLTGGEVLAVIGENGAGKSTLMKIIGGVHRPDAGTVTLQGQPVVLNDPAEALRLGIRVIYQELSAIDNLDVAANLFLGFEKRKGLFLDDRAMRTRASEILKRIGFDIAPTTPIAALSVAQRQLVEIARALTLDVKALILDEPTSSLTPGEAKNLFRLVRDLKADGVGIIYISHRLDEIIELADRVTVLRDGRNAGELTKAEITEPTMVRLMVGRDLEPPVPRFHQAGKVRLELRGVRTQRFPHHPVTLEVREGEITGMAGLVGSGRTELAQAVFGIERFVGEVWIYGQLARIHEPSDAIRHGLFLVPEDRKEHGLTLESSVGHNISLPSLKKLSKVGLVSLAQEEAYDDQGIQDLAIKTASRDTLAKNLSGGNQQKIVLARWFLKQPQVLVVDEPTRGVDVGSKAEIYEQIRALANTGVAVWVISSDMEELLKLCDRIVVMHEGQIAGEVAAADATEEKIMQFAVAGQS